MNARFNDPSRAQRELLSGSQLFSGLPAPVLDALVTACRVLELPANQTLYEAGKAIREAHLLFSGSLKRSTVIPGGTTKVLELVQSEQLLSLGELFSATYYAATCSTMTRSVLVAIDIRKLREATQTCHELSSRIIAALASRQFATEFDVTRQNYGLTGTQRLLDYLLEMGGQETGLAGETTVVLKASKKVIAARLGMTPESLSRNLRELSDSGVVVVDGRKVHIQNAAVLDSVDGSTQQRLNFTRKRKGDVLNTPALSSGALVNLCGRLRVLSQRMAIAWCMIALAIAPTKGRVKLHQLEREFERHLLRFDTLEQCTGLGRQLAAVKAIWPRYRHILSSEEASAGQAETVFELSEKMLEATDQLASQAVALTGSPEVRYVNIAGRNRMLSQRISKFFLLLGRDGLDARIVALLPLSCQEFEDNLQTLEKTGNTPPGVAAQLKVVAGQWQKYVRAMCPDLSNASRSKHARLVLTEGERLLRSVDTTVKLFERLTR